MFILGFLSLLQMTFLPGFLLLRLFSLKLNFLITLIFSFALSLVTNYVAVFFLTAVGIYTRSTVFVVFATELLMLVLLCLKSGLAGLNVKFFPVVDKSINDFYQTLNSIIQERYSVHPFFCWAVVIGAFLSIAWAGLFLCGNLFYLTVFNRYDAVVLWNNWALDWFANKLPYHTWHYPQLMPANWSLSYQFLGTQIQYFPQAIMPLFTIYLLITMFQLGVLKRRLGYIIGTTATALFIRHAFGGMVESGLIDLPLAFMSFLAVACLLMAQEISEFKEIKKYLILGGIFACGAAVTKQMGAMILMLYPLLAYLLVLRVRVDIALKDVLKIAFIYLIFALVIVAPFYIYKELQILFGLDYSELGTITSALYQGSSLLQRLIYSIKIFLSYNIFFLNFISDYYSHFIVGILLGLVYLSLLLLSTLDKSYRILFILIFVPYSLLWSMFACYDTRNYALAVPFYGLGFGIGLEQLLFFKHGYFGKKLWQVCSTIRFYHLLVLGLIFLFCIDSRYPSEYLLMRQKDLNLEIFNYKLNKKMLSYKNAHKFDKKILTDYHFKNIFYLSDIQYIFQHFYVSSEPKYCGTKSPNAEFYQQYLKNIKNPEIGYLLVCEPFYDELRKDIEENLKNNNFELIFKKAGYWFISVRI